MGETLTARTPHVLTNVWGLFWSLRQIEHTLRVMEYFYSANICGSTMGSMETLFKGAIQRSTFQASKVLAVRKKLRCNPVKCTLLDVDSVTLKHRTFNGWMDQALLCWSYFFCVWLCLGFWIKAASVRVQWESIYIRSPHFKDWNLPLSCCCCC